METDLNQLFKTVDQLSPGELNLLRQRIDQSQRKKAVSTSRSYPEDATGLFAIPFDKYLAMTEEERDAIAFQAYRILDHWIDQELKFRHARWMLVCGGQILEWSQKLIEYPSHEKIMAIGQERGLIPFVFIRTPLIEESSWSGIADLDYYPTLPITVAKFTATKDELLSDGVALEADFDTGSADLLLDYDQLVSSGIIKRLPLDQAHYYYHLGEFYRAHLLPITIGITDDREQTITKKFGALVVRDWRKSPLCLVNPAREALGGRNLLLDFPLRVELDGEKKTTKIVGKKTSTPKSKKRN
ncbi:hypothetical protein L0152_24370 [bacterium]|nr:hypothetical protein [bacterium]